MLALNLGFGDAVKDPGNGSRKNAGEAEVVKLVFAALERLGSTGLGLPPRDVTGADRSAESRVLESYSLQQFCLEMQLPWVPNAQNATQKFDQNALL